MVRGAEGLDREQAALAVVQSPLEQADVGLLARLDHAEWVVPCGQFGDQPVRGRMGTVAGDVVAGIGCAGIVGWCALLSVSESRCGSVSVEFVGLRAVDLDEVPARFAFLGKTRRPAGPRSAPGRTVGVERVERVVQVVEGVVTAVIVVVVVQRAGVSRFGDAEAWHWRISW